MTLAQILKNVFIDKSRLKILISHLISELANANSSVVNQNLVAIFKIIPL